MLASGSPEVHDSRHGAVPPAHAAAARGRARARISAPRGPGAAAAELARSTSGWRSRRASTRPWTTPGGAAAVPQVRGGGSASWTAGVHSGGTAEYSKRARRERGTTRNRKARGGERREASVIRRRRRRRRTRAGSSRGSVRGRESAWTCSADDNDRRRRTASAKSARAFRNASHWTRDVTENADFSIPKKRDVNGLAFGRSPSVFPRARRDGAVEHGTAAKDGLRGYYRAKIEEFELAVRDEPRTCGASRRRGTSSTRKVRQTLSREGDVGWNGSQI